MSHGFWRVDNIICHMSGFMRHCLMLCFWAVWRFGDSCLGGSMIFSSCLLYKKSTEQMKKVPTIVLSVSYKGVKFIDATNKVSSSV